MLTSMVWGAGKIGPAKFPAIETRPRAPAVRLMSASSTVNISTRPHPDRSNIANDSLSSTITLDTSDHDSATRSSPAKRPRGHPPGVAAGPRERRQHECSICSHVFARAEHLTRHERSHRKERPFSCVHCNATFTRKDLLKRHLTHNHPELFPATKPPAAESVDEGDAPGSVQNESVRGSVSTETDLPQLGIESHGAGIGAEALQGNPESTAFPDLIGDMMTGSQMEGNALEHFDFGSLLRDMNGGQLLLHNPSALEGLLSDDPNTGLNFAFHPSMLNQSSHGIASLPPGGSFANSPVATAASKPDIYGIDPAQFIYIQKRDGGHSSISISESKRNLIVQDTETVFSLARVPDTFRVPSCMAMERYITAFFDAFLVHAPCIHMATFRTENAQPSLILAMSALGAQYHEEQDTAMQLHQAARLSILNQMEKTSFTSKGRPTWILQSLFLNMSFGVWRSDFDAVQESLAMQSNLGHIVRYVSYPGARWVDDTNDPYLSWEQWIELETTKRTKFLIYTFFNDLTVAYNIPPVITNSEIDMDLPCDEDLWMADSKASWSKQTRLSSASFQPTLRSLMAASDIATLQCSTFGCHIILSALSQQIWQSRQAASPAEDLPGLAKFEVALQNWQLMAAKAKQMGVAGSKFESFLSHDSMALLRLVHIMLCLDTSRLKTVICRQDAQGIAQGMRSHCGDVLRSKIASKAALFAIHAFRRIVKAGVNVVARRGFLELSPQTYLSWFDSCLFISKWLETFEVNQQSQPPSHEEERIQSLVQQTLYEVDPYLLRSTRPLSVQIMRTWATVFLRHETWGVVPILGQGMQTYAGTWE